MKNALLLIIYLLSSNLLIAQISNNDCASAETLVLDVNNQASASFNTNDATASGVNPTCETNPADGWYKFTMPFAGNLLISNASANTEYAVFDACGGSQLSCISGGNHTFALSNGAEYFIQAFRINGTNGNMSFTITATATIANDDCASAEALTLDVNNQASATLNTNGASHSGTSPSCETNPRDGWYKFTMPFAGNLLISNASSNTEYAVFDACGGSQLSCAGAGNHTFALSSGTEYFIQAFRVNGTDGSMSFTITATATITNDDCASAEALTLDVNNQASATLNTNGASHSGTSPSCETNPRDGWYKFTMPFAGNLLISNASSNTEYAVFDACGGSQLSCAGAGNHTFALSSGTEYFIQAFRVNGTDGSMSFTITATATITNDDCASAEALTLDVNNQASATLNTNGASHSGTSPSCETNPRDGWYKFTMPFAGNLLISNASSNTEYAVFDACGGSQLSCAGAGNHTFALSSGTEYFIQAFRVNGTDGSMSFTITATATITNDDCASAEALTLDINNQASATLNTNGASHSGTSPSCETNPRDGWYKFTMPFAGNLLISNASSNTEYAVFDACGGSQLSCAGAGNHTFALSSGTEYFIQAFRVNGTDGSMSFTITATATITNDDCANAFSLVFDATYSSSNSFDTNGASHSGVDPSCETNPRDGWYTMVSPINGSYTIGGSSNTEFAIYEEDAATCYGSEIACISSGNTFDVVQGNSYMIQAWRKNGTDGTMNVNLTPSIIPVSDGTRGACEAIPTVTIDASNNDEWVVILDAGGDVVAAIKANGQNLGDITTNLKIDADDVRTFGPTNIPYLRREVEISPANAPSSGVDVRLYLLGDEFDDLAAVDPTLMTIDDLRFYKEDVSGCTSGYGGTGSPFNSGNGDYDDTDYFMEFSVSSFSTFFPVSNGVSLPVELHSFEARANGRENELLWLSLAEVNTSRYEIQRSGDGITWKSLDEISASGVPGEPKSYFYADTQPLPVSFYRLKIIDRDESFEYSEVLVVNNQAGRRSITLHPNPVKDEFTLEGLGEAEKIWLLDSKGAIIRELGLEEDASWNVESLTPGAYFLKIIAKDQVELIKMLKF